jgi:hypothetical protein
MLCGITGRIRELSVRSVYVACLVPLVVCSGCLAKVAMPGGRRLVTSQGRRWKSLGYPVEAVRSVESRYAKGRLICSSRYAGVASLRLPPISHTSAESTLRDQLATAPGVESTDDSNAVVAGCVQGTGPTNVAFGPKGSTRIFIVDDEHGRIETADVGVDGLPLVA